MNAKIYNGNVQPNPKEYKIWVNDEGIIKTWNGTEWIELSGASSGGSGESGGESDFALYYQKELDSTNNLGLISGVMIMGGFPCVIKVITDAVRTYGTPHTFNPMTSITSGIVQIQFIRVHTAVSESFEEYPFYTDEDIKLRLGGLLNAFTPITKEQFYSLEA